MRKNNLINLILFMICFTIGISAIFCAICCDEILNYFQQNIRTAQLTEANIAIKEMDQRTIALISQIEENPEILKRLVPITMGIDPNEPNIISPTVSNYNYQLAKGIIATQKKKDIHRTSIPNWLLRCNSPTSRKILFFAGCGMILVCFTFFGLTSTDKKSPPEN